MAKKERVLTDAIRYREQAFLGAFVTVLLAGTTINQWTVEDVDVSQEPEYMVPATQQYLSAKFTEQAENIALELVENKDTASAEETADISIAPDWAAIKTIAAANYRVDQRGFLAICLPFVTLYVAFASACEANNWRKAVKSERAQDARAQAPDLAME